MQTTDERDRTLVAILITGEMVTLAPDTVSEEDFRALALYTGDVVERGEPVYGYTPGGDFVVIPAKSVLYLRGLK